MSEAQKEVEGQKEGGKVIIRIVMFMKNKMNENIAAYRTMTIPALPILQPVD